MSGTARGTLSPVPAPTAVPEQRDDRETLARIAEGRGEAFAELYERYFRELYDFAARITRDRAAAADVVQTVFASVWERARTGEEVRYPRPWLYRVAHNAAVDELRRRKWTSGADGDQGFDFAAVEDVGSDEPERFVIKKELAELVWSTAATLSPEEYALLDLYVRRELAPDELADQFGITTGAVYTRLSRVRRSFEEALTATLLLRRGGRDCTELESLVAELGPSAETPEGRRLVRAHIRRCSRCQTARRRYVTAAEMLASFAPVAVMPGAQDAIWSSLSALLGLGGAAGGAAAAHAEGAAHAPHSLLAHARAHPLASAAGGVTLAVLVGAGVWAARDAIQHSPPAAHDPSHVWSPDHAVGRRSTENRIKIAWSREGDAVSYSVLWSHAPRSEPDALADLPGSATGTTSPKLVPGRWYFHLRTKGRDGSWTHTVHLGPFIVAAPFTPPARPHHGNPHAKQSGTAPAGSGSGSGSSVSQASASSGGSTSRATSAGNATTTTPGSGGSSSPPAGGTPPAARDTTPPSGQAVRLAGGPYYRTLEVPLVITRGSDRGSGVDSASGVAQRSVAALSNGSCGTWSGWSTVSLRGSTDATVADGSCYRYRYRIADRAGNRSAFSKPSGSAAVDTTPPAAPTLTLSENGPDTLVAGATLVYRPTGAGGTFAAAASSGDAGSGLAAIEFPGLANGMAPTAATRRTEAPYELAYAWTSGATEAGTKVVTAYDRAGNSASTTFTVASDETGPEGLSAAIPADPWFADRVPVAVGLGTDVVSGVDAASMRVERDSAPLSAAGCLFGGAWGVVTLSGGADTSVGPSRCYRYRVSVADNVGNRSTSPPSSEARIDSSPPSAPELALSESSPNLFETGATLFYRPSAAGSFVVDAASVDPESGIAQILFPTIAGATGGGPDITAPYEAGYSWDNGLAAAGALPVIASNGASLTASSSFALVPDADSPTGMSVTLLGGDTFPGHAVPMKIDTGADTGSGLDPQSEQIERDRAPMVAGVCGLYSGAWAPLSLHGAADTSVEAGNCYRYRVSVADNVGNRATSEPSRDARVG